MQTGNQENINSPEIPNSPQPALPANGYCPSSFLMQNANLPNSCANLASSRGGFANSLSANSLVSSGLLTNGLLNGGLLPPNVAAALNAAHLAANSLSANNPAGSEQSNSTAANAYSRLEQQLGNPSQYGSIYQHYLASLMAASSGQLGGGGALAKLNAAANLGPPIGGLNGGGLNGGGPGQPLNSALNSGLNSGLNAGTPTNQQCSASSNHNNDTSCTLGQSIAKLEPMESKQTPLYFV